MIFESINYVRDNIIKHGNSFGVSAKEKASWAKGLDLPSSGETIFFASCMDPLMGYAETLLKGTESFEKTGLDYGTLIGTYRKLEKFKVTGPLAKLAVKVSKSNEKYQESLIHAVKVLRQFDVDIAYLYEDEPCCGGPLHTYGFMDEFSEHVVKVYDKLKAKGVKRIITLNPPCATVFSKYYPELVKGFDIEVRHFTDVVSEKLNEKKTKLALDGEVKVVFHDPCYLARYLNISEAPREILHSIEGVELFEPTNNKRMTKCCGGGGLEVTFPHIAKAIARDRTKELLDTGANKIVTACAPCRLMLEISKPKAGVEVLDIADVVYQALKKD